MSDVQAVLFDFAGVLTSSPWGAMTEAGGGNLELLIGPYEEDSDHPWHQVERGELAIADWAVAVSELGRAQGIEVDFAPLQALLGEMTLHEQVIERVRTLRTEGYRLALITNNVREGSATWRAMLPVDELFDVVVDSSDVGMRKPNPGDLPPRARAPRRHPAGGRRLPGRHPQQRGRGPAGWPARDPRGRPGRCARGLGRTAARAAGEPRRLPHLVPRSCPASACG